MEYEYSYAAIALGVLSILGGMFNWGVFAEQKQTQRFSHFASHVHVRIFYVILGIGLVVLGAMPILDEQKNATSALGNPSHYKAIPDSPSIEAPAEK